LKKNHTDHFVAINMFLNCIYHYNVEDHENLLKALKEGTLSTKHTDEDIRDLRGTKAFRQRYDKYLRKEIRPPTIMCGMLDDWFDRFKCTASEGSRPGRGRRDPRTGETLFTSDTKEAIRLAKVNAKHLQDPLPIQQMYYVIEPNPNAPHQLKECMSRRGESSLESFHLMLAHFGNTGMRTTLADNLNLTGTARHNIAIRHRLRLTTLTQGSRKKIPAAYEGLVSFFNHSELAYINSLATKTGTSPQNLPFQHVEKLAPDNGERFFSEYITWMNETKPQYDLQSRCICKVCSNTLTSRIEQQPQQQTTNEGEQTLMPRSNPTPEESIINKPTAASSPKINSANTTVHQANASVQPKEQVLVRIQQHQQQQQKCQQHQHQVPIQPHPCVPIPPYPTPMMGTGYYTPMPTFFSPHQPWTATNNPFTGHTPNTPVFCCGSYRQWHNTAGRRGRPPHDDHCHPERRRRSNKEKNRRDDHCFRLV